MREDLKKAMQSNTSGGHVDLIDNLTFETLYSVAIDNIFKACLNLRHVYKAARPHGPTAEINFGFMYTIVYDGGPRPQGPNPQKQMKDSFLGTFQGLIYLSFS